MTPSTNKSILTILAAAALLVTMAASSPALAAANNGGFGTAKSKSDLEAEGWTCVVVSTNFWSCTKPGEKEQWCDAGSCQPAPMKGGTKPKLPKANINSTMQNHG